MMLLALVFLPALGAVGAYAHRVLAYRTAWLVSVAALHVVLVSDTWIDPPPPALNGWLALDALGLVVITTVSVLFAVVALYAVGYLRRENPRGGRAFVSCLLAFLASASLVSMSHHLALLWVGMEATTLAFAPLIFHRHDRRSLEAAWKYLVISSVGIALALLGTFFLATAQASAAPGGRPLVLEDLLAGASRLHPAWLRAAFVFLLAGYGTKMGLAPMHTWKPDTYGEAPALVGGLMAGGLTSCAFLGLARATQVAMAARQGSFVQPPLIAFGLVSLAVAAVFIIGQTDVKRLLAYSSVEHAGLLVLGLGLGGVGVYGSVLHVINNALVKGLLFLAVGNVVLATGTATAASVRGLVRGLPASGLLLLVGLFAVTGSPPFGPFVSEFTILRAAMSGGHLWVAAVMLMLLVMIFIGLAAMILEIVYRPPPANRDLHSPPRAESGWLVAGPVALGLGVLALGLVIPRPLQALLSLAASALGGAA